MLRSRLVPTGAVAALLLVGGVGGCAAPAEESPEPSPTPAVVTITPTGMSSVDAISTDARWLVGTEPRQDGSSTPKPLVRKDLSAGDETVLCDWADPELGYCSLAEQGGMIPERPELLLELVDDNAVRGWFPSGGVFLVDSATGERTRIDTDSSGTPLEPAWTAEPCGHECDYHRAPRLNISTDAVSGDGRVAAFCANYEVPKEPILYVKDLVSGELTRTSVRCGVTRFGREDDDDEWADEAMSYPQLSSDGDLVHVTGDQSTGGEYGMLGWRADTLYLTGTGEARSIPGSGAMTRDGRLLFLRSGEQPDVPEADVAVDYVMYDVASGSTTPQPWMLDFLATGITFAPVPDTFTQASSDGGLLLNATTVHDVVTGAETDIAALLRQRGYDPTDEWGPLRVSGDGSTILADVVEGEALAESNNAVLMITAWVTEPTADGEGESEAGS